MSAPSRPPVLLRAAAVVVALFALIGFVAAAGAGGKGKGAADGGTTRDGGAARPMTYFPASKSPGGMHFNSDEDVSAAAGNAGDGGAKKPRMYFPASKSAGDLFPQDQQGLSGLGLKGEGTGEQQQQSPAQQVQQR